MAIEKEGHRDTARKQTVITLLKQTILDPLLDPLFRIIHHLTRHNVLGGI